MHRSGRVALTALSAAAIVSAAGLAAASATQPADPQPTAAAAAVVAAPAAAADQDRRAELVEYLRAMAERGARLEDRIHRAEARLAAVRAAREEQVTRAQGQDDWAEDEYEDDEHHGEDDDD